MTGASVMSFLTLTLQSNLIVAIAWVVALAQAQFVLAASGFFATLRPTDPSGFSSIQALVLVVWRVLAVAQLGQPRRHEIITWEGLLDYNSFLDLSLRNCAPFVFVFYGLFEGARAFDSSHWRLLQKYKQLPAWIIVFRNILLWVVLEYIVATIFALQDCDGSIWSDQPASEQIQIVVAKWRSYHDRKYVLVRLTHMVGLFSHTIMWTRPSLTHFMWWFMYGYVSDAVVGDMAHYVDDPKAARARDKFEEGISQVDKQMIRQLLAYPVNLVGLAKHLYNDW